MPIPIRVLAGHYEPVRMVRPAGSLRGLGDTGCSVVERLGGIVLNRTASVPMDPQPSGFHGKAPVARSVPST
jgi:hypothetical protein